MWTAARDHQVIYIVHYCIISGRQVQTSKKSRKKIEVDPRKELTEDYTLI